MKRHLMQVLKRWKSTSRRKPFLLRGARQVGKTYLLKAFGEKAFPRYHYVNFEEDELTQTIFQKDLKPTRILNELQLYLDREIDSKRDFLIFDEIQQCPRALTSLKYFYTELPELAIGAAGSLLGVCLSKESFPVGYVTFGDLYPLNFIEFLEGIEKKSLAELAKNHDLTTPFPDVAHEKLWELWKHYLVVGGLPEVINIYREHQVNLYRAMQAIRATQRDLVDTYMADIAKHSGKLNAMHIERLWRNIPVQLARTQDGSASKYRFKDAIPGFRSYERLAAPLGWLENANLLIRTSIVKKASRPLMGYAKENWFKLYFFDVGLLGAVSGIPPVVILSYDFGSYKGYVAENIVAQEIRGSGVRDIFCWLGRTSEVEFLLETEKGIVPLEVKSGHMTQSKSLTVYVERFQPPSAYVISAKNCQVSRTRHFIPLYATGSLVRKLKE